MASWAELRDMLAKPLEDSDDLPAVRELLRLIDDDDPAGDKIRRAAILEMCELAKQQIETERRRLCRG